MRSYKRTGVSLLLLLSLFLATQTFQSAAVQEATRTVSARGAINSGGTHGQLIYSANFDDLSGGQVITGSSIPGFPSGLTYIVRDGSTRVWCEDGTQSSIPMRRGVGTKCLGLQVYQGSKRCELDIYLQKSPVSISQKAYIVVWLYLPTNFQVQRDSGGGEGYFEIFNSMCAVNEANGYYPKAVTHLKQHIPPNSPFWVQNFVATGAGEQYRTIVGQPDPFALPIGQWFTIKAFVDRGTSANNDGINQVWINDVLVGSGTGLPMWGTVSSWFAEIAKIYGYFYSGDAMVWCDGFEIWTDIP